MKKKKKVITGGPGYPFLDSSFDSLLTKYIKAAFL